MIMSTFQNTPCLQYEEEIRGDQCKNSKNTCDTTATV